MKYNLLCHFTAQSSVQVNSVVFIFLDYLQFLSHNANSLRLNPVSSIRSSFFLDTFKVRRLFPQHAIKRYLSEFSRLSHPRPTESSEWVMSLDVAKVIPHNVVSSWCHLFYQVHQFLLQWFSSRTWCYHLHGSQLEWFSYWTVPIFPFKCSNAYYAPTVSLYFHHQTSGHASTKMKVFVPVWICKLQSFFLLYVLE